MSTLLQLKTISAELTDLYHVSALLQWDQEVTMPHHAAESRARQCAIVSRLIHQRETDKRLGCLLDAAENQLDTWPVPAKALVRIMRRNFDHNTKLPEEFVVEFAQLTSAAQGIWLEARKHSDFTLFKETLSRIVDMSRQQADFLGYTDHPYDALLDIYEEGLTTAQVETMFADLKAPLGNMVSQLRSYKDLPQSYSPPFRVSDQEHFSKKILAHIGFDFDRGCLARSAHPFSTSLGHNDRRVTNRYNREAHDFIFSALHEGGHALYEQGISKELAGTHLDSGISLGIHESQSRLWENIIGRNINFWEKLYPELQSSFPAQFNTVSLPHFIETINQVKPGLIRVDADEVSYNLHVMIRFELEKLLLEKSLTVADLVTAWNEKYSNYLGVEVDSDANGVLQDIHWAHGSLGYFPTYTIGNLASAQIWHRYTQYDPDFRETLRAGNLVKIKEWLSNNIYCHGSVYPPAELLKRVTGEDLSATYFLKYLEEKYC